jgi:hypothetical protein
VLCGGIALSFSATFDFTGLEFMNQNSIRGQLRVTLLWFAGSGAVAAALAFFTPIAAWLGGPAVQSGIAPLTSVNDPLAGVGLASVLCMFAGLLALIVVFDVMTARRRGAAVNRANGDGLPPSSGRTGRSMPIGSSPSA